jgi:hypothetical protein
VEAQIVKAQVAAKQDVNIVVASVDASDTSNKNILGI